MNALVRWHPLRVLTAALVPWVALWAAVALTVPLELASALMALGLLVVPTSIVALTSTAAGAAAWSLGRGARFSPEWNDLLWRHLTRTRVARTLGVTLGFSLPLMVNAAYNANGGELVPWWPRQANQVAGYWMPALGYVVGSVWAEVRKPRPLVGDASGAALLSPRRLGDYLDPNVMWALGTFALAAAFVIGVWAFAPLPLSSFSPDPMWVRVVAPAAVAIGALGAARWLSRRVERATDDAALAYEELTRTATVNALVGASIAMIGEFAASITSVPRHGYQVSGWYLLVPSLLALVGLGIWAGCGTKLVFRSRRIDALRAAA